MSRLSHEEEESVRLKLREQRTALDNLQDLRFAAEDHLNNKCLEMDNIIEKLLKSLVLKGDEIKSELDESMIPFLDAITSEVRQRNRIVSSLTHMLNGNLPITSTQRQQVSFKQINELPVLATIDQDALKNIEKAVEGLLLGATGLGDQGEAKENQPPVEVDHQYQLTGVGRGCKMVARAPLLQPAVATPSPSPNHFVYPNSPAPQGLLIPAYKMNAAGLIHDNTRSQATPATEFKPDSLIVVKSKSSMGNRSKCVLSDKDKLFMNRDKWDSDTIAKYKVLMWKTLDFNRFLAKVANEEAGLVEMWGDIPGVDVANLVVTEDGCLYFMNPENGEIDCYSSQPSGRLTRTDSFFLSTSFDRGRVLFSMARDETHVFTVALSADTCRLEVTKLPLDEIKHLSSTNPTNRKLIEWYCDEFTPPGRNFQLKVDDQICILQEHAEEDLFLLALNKTDLSPSNRRVFRSGKFFSLSLARNNVFVMHGKVFFIREQLNEKFELVGLYVCEFMRELSFTSQVIFGAKDYGKTPWPLRFRGCSVCGDFLMIHLTNQADGEPRNNIWFCHFGFTSEPCRRRFFILKPEEEGSVGNGSPDYAMMAAASFSSNHPYVLCCNNSHIKVAKFLPNIH